MLITVIYGGESPLITSLSCYHSHQMINNVHYTQILQINSTYCQIVPIFESLALFGTVSYIAK